MLVAAGILVVAGGFVGWMVGTATRNYDPGDGPDTGRRWHDANHNPLP
jgi:hypothetical protein